MLKSSFASVVSDRSLLSIQRFDHKSDFSENEEVPTINRSDVSISGKIGQGGFSCVFRVSIGAGEDKEEAATSGNLRRACTASTQEYALKRLDLKKLRTEDAFISAANDFAWEASILSKLCHPNIIQLQGVCSETLSESFRNSEGGSGYFILLDLLYETLADRIDRWRKVDDANQHLTIFRSIENRQTRVDGLHRRLQNIGIAVARAMTYLHEKQIVLRDLKPANIGFDNTSGTLKLFDFGMARPLDRCSMVEVAGSLRYMAGEVMKGNNSGLPSDVYSFGVLLWEVCTLQKPFCRCVRTSEKNYKQGEYERLFKEKIGGPGGWRPSVKSIPCKRTRRLIQDCWDASPEARPTFPSILMMLTAICSNKKAFCWSCLSPSSSSSLGSFTIDEIPSLTTSIKSEISTTRGHEEAMNTADGPPRSAAAGGAVPSCSCCYGRSSKSSFSLFSNKDNSIRSLDHSSRKTPLTKRKSFLRTVSCSKLLGQK
jgi:serine/threonine protein kinase